MKRLGYLFFFRIDKALKVKTKQNKTPTKLVSRNVRTEINTRWEIFSFFLFFFPSSIYHSFDLTNARKKWVCKRAASRYLESVYSLSENRVFRAGTVSFRVENRVYRTHDLQQLVIWIRKSQFLTVNGFLHSVKNRLEKETQSGGTVVYQQS